MPADYVSELADRAFKKIAAGTGDAMVVILSDRPQDAATLVNQLNSRPDLQAQVASFAGYTPSEWLLEHELTQVDERRKKVGSEPVSSTGSAYDRAAASGLMGLCFSGGGIRSATFNLGILQGLPNSDCCAALIIFRRSPVVVRSISGLLRGSNAVPLRKSNDSSFRFLKPAAPILIQNPCVGCGDTATI